MIELQANNEHVNDFLLRDQLKQKEIATLHFLFNSQFQLAREKLQEKTPIHTQMKKYQRSVSINSEQFRRSFNALSQKLREKYLREDKECIKSLNKLQTLWQAKKIEIFHRYYFERYIENTHMKNIATLIRNEDHLIRLNQHIYFSIEKAIWARQACLNHLKRSLTNLGPQDMHEHFQTVKDRELEKNRKMQQRVYKVYGYRAKYILDERETKLGVTKMQMLSEDINNYRKLTYHLIQLITNWKLYIQSLTHDLRLRRQKIEFYHFDYNYLLYILNDSSFISTSFLANFYTFAIKNDPFLLRPILNIEKLIEEGKQVTFQAHQLKKIINCKIDDVPRMVLALNQLHKQVEWNLIHIKYSEKSNFLKFKSVTLQKIKSQKKFPQIKSITSSNLVSQFSNRASLSEPKRQKSLLSSKSNILQRKTSLLSNTSLSNTLQGKKFRINNPQTKSNIKLFDNQELKSLKEQLYHKIKQQLQYSTKRSILESKAFTELVNQQVKDSFQKQLNNQQQQIMRNSIEITPLSFAEQEISNYITLIYKQIPVQYKQMQTLQKDLIKQVLEAKYSYILKVHTKTMEVGNIVAFCNRQIKQYKSIEIKLFSFRFQRLFQKIVLKLVEFLCNYDNAKQIAFSLKYNNEQTLRFVKQISKKLQLNCIIIEKRHKTYTESRFVFTNKDFNKRYVYNPHPQKVHFKLYSALCLQKLHLQTFNELKLSKFINYDYLIMQILKRYTNSEDFHILRDTFQQKERLRYLLNQLMEIQSHKQYQIDMTILEQQNLMNINKKLKYINKPLLQASDLILINNIKLIMLEYTLTIAYKLQVLSPGNGQMCHRYAINEEISYLCDSKGTQFYLLPVQQSHHLKIILFSAHQYLKDNNKDLNLYLFETLAKKEWMKKNIESMWIQMMRYPQNYSEREQFMLSTHRVNDFDSIKKQLLIGDTFDWFSDIQIQNGIQYAMQKNDLHLKMPLGVGIITNKNWIIYCRVLQRGQTLISENV